MNIFGKDVKILNKNNLTIFEKQGKNENMNNFVKVHNKIWKCEHFLKHPNKIWKLKLFWNFCIIFETAEISGNMIIFLK